MIKIIYSILLLPLLAIQGFYVRRVTPRLPEPEGSRNGKIGTAPYLRVLILGDSAAAGVGVAQQKQALSGQLVNLLSEEHNICWQLKAVTGDNSKQVLARLEQLQSQTFDIVVISVGVNDVTSGTSLANWRNNLQTISQQLKEQHQVACIYWSCVPPMEHFPALPQPLRWFLGQRVKSLNTVLQNVCENDAKCHFVQAPFPITQEYIASDGFHPGEPAYYVWANYLACLITANIKADNSK